MFQFVGVLQCQEHVISKGQSYVTVRRNVAMTSNITVSHYSL